MTFVQCIKAFACSMEVRADGFIVEVIIWELPDPLSPSVHSYKHRLAWTC